MDNLWSVSKTIVCWIVKSLKLKCTYFSKPNFTIRSASPTKLETTRNTEKWQSQRLHLMKIWSRETSQGSCAAGKVENNCQGQYPSGFASAWSLSSGRRKLLLEEQHHPRFSLHLVSSHVPCSGQTRGRAQQWLLAHAAVLLICLLTFKTVAWPLDPVLKSKIIEIKPEVQAPEFKYTSCQVRRFSRSANKN